MQLQKCGAELLKPSMDGVDTTVTTQAARHVKQYRELVEQKPVQGPVEGLPLV